MFSNFIYRKLQKPILPTVGFVFNLIEVQIMVKSHILSNPNTSQKKRVDVSIRPDKEGSSLGCQTTRFLEFFRWNWADPRVFFILPNSKEAETDQSNERKLGGQFRVSKMIFKALPHLEESHIWRVTPSNLTQLPWEPRLLSPKIEAAGAITNEKRLRL